MERIEPTYGEDSPPPRRDHASRRPNRSPVPIVGLAVVIAAIAAAAAYFFWPREAPPPAPAVAAAPPQKAEPQAPKHPVDAQPESPLPALKESDGPVAAALAALVGLDAFGQVFVTEDLVRKLVATIDNLPRETVAQRVSALRPVPGRPAVAGKDSTLALAPANAARYAPHLRMLESVGTEKMVAFYRRHYPLFQEAYVQLGYPNGYFNDRLVEVIDHLLETPDPAGPLLLTQPKVLYEFADPALEERSAGQKMLLRLGREGREKVKAKLQEIRAAVASAGGVTATGRP